MTAAASAVTTVADGPAVGPASDLVDIVSGSFGAGHDAAAGAIAAQFRSRGYRTRVFDIVDLMPSALGRGCGLPTSARSRSRRRATGGWLTTPISATASTGGSPTAWPVLTKP